MSRKTKANEIKALLHNLFDADDAVAIDAVEQLHTKGDETCVAPLLDVLISNPSNKLSFKVIQLLSDLKHTKGMETFVSHIGDEKYVSIAHTMLGIAWNNNDMDLTKSLQPIVQWSLETTLYAAIEGSTAVESIEGDVPEEDVLEALVSCNKFLANNPESDKTEFVNNIHTHLKKLERAQ